MERGCINSLRASIESITNEGSHARISQQGSPKFKFSTSGVVSKHNQPSAPLLLFVLGRVLVLLQLARRCSNCGA